MRLSKSVGSCPLGTYQFLLILFNMIVCNVALSHFWCKVSANRMPCKAKKYFFSVYRAEVPSNLTNKVSANLCPAKRKIFFSVCRAEVLPNLTWKAGYLLIAGVLFEFLVQVQTFLRNREYGSKASVLIVNRGALVVCFCVFAKSNEVLTSPAFPYQF